MDSTTRLRTSSPPPPGFLLSSPSDWDYFAEGASNILFRYTGSHPYFTPFLLRLRKSLPGSPTTQQLYDHLTTRFSPILGDYLMRHDLIQLAPGFVKELNGRLPNGGEGEDWAGRPVQKKRMRWLEEGEEWGILVEDMSCGNYLFEMGELEEEEEEEEEEEKEGMWDQERWLDMATIEFKPKWLTQSPNAPPGWMLCRTCAIRAMAKGKQKGRDANAEPPDEGDEEEDDDEDRLPEFCPLDLASGDRSRIEAAVFAIVNNPHNSVMIADPSPDSDAGSISDSGKPPLPPLTSLNLDADSSPPLTLAHYLAQSLESSLVTLLTHFFSTSRIIPLLAQLQGDFGARGVFTSATLQLMNGTDRESQEAIEMALLEKNGEVNDIWTAMTLRDASLFLKVWVRKRKGRGMEAKIEAKVADVDLKTGEGGRAVYWRDVERRLRQGGWYGHVNRGGRRNCRTGEGIP